MRCTARRSRRAQAIQSTGGSMSLTLQHLDRRPAASTLSQPASMGLAERLQSRQAHVVVMGLGYAGLPMAVEFARAGFQVTGLDIDEHRVQLVNRGQSPVSDVAGAAISALINDGRFQASSRFE